MNKNSLKSMLTLAVAGTLALASQTARADASCTDLIAGVQHGVASGQYVTVYLSLHRQDPNWGVQYSSGFLAGGGNGTLFGHATEYFSIRTNASRIPFSGDTENLTWTMSPSGLMNIHNDSWNFNMSPVDFTCAGNMMTRYVPGDGVYTLTFGNYVAPIQ